MVLKGNTMGCWPYEKIIKEFHIGDTVKLINNGNMNASVGATAIVVGFEEDLDDGNYYLQVRWIRNGLDREQCDGGYYPSDFVVVSKNIVNEKNNNCPRCNGELKDHMSFGLGEMIKKCEKCGWC